VSQRILNGRIRGSLILYDNNCLQFEAMRGYDMHRNETNDWSAKGRYSTRLFTEEAVSVIRSHDKRHPLFLYVAHLAPHTGNPDNPFQAPNETIRQFSHIGDPERRIYAGKSRHTGSKMHRSLVDARLRISNKFIAIKIVKAGDFYNR
jgi:hypothetical protein